LAWKGETSDQKAKKSEKIIYPNKSTERIRVEAKNYFEALEEGLERRRSLDMPLMVDIRG